jgi:hypothetical protein
MWSAFAPVCECVPSMTMVPPVSETFHSEPMVVLPSKPSQTMNEPGQSVGGVTQEVPEHVMPVGHEAGLPH